MKIRCVGNWLIDRPCIRYIATFSDSTAAVIIIIDLPSLASKLTHYRIQFAIILSRKLHELNDGRIFDSGITNLNLDALHLCTLPS